MKPSYHEAPIIQEDPNHEQLGFKECGAVKKYSEGKIKKGTKSSNQTAINLFLPCCISLLFDGQAQHIPFATYLTLYNTSSQNYES